MEGEVPPGALIALFPGLVYGKDAYRCAWKRGSQSRFFRSNIPCGMSLPCGIALAMFGSACTAGHDVCKGRGLGVPGCRLAAANSIMGASTRFSCCQQSFAGVSMLQTLLLLLL